MDLPNRVIREVSDKVAKDVLGWLADNPDALSFDNIFGEKFRNIYPYISPKMRLIKNKIEAFPKGYQVDLSNNTVKQTVKTNQGPKERVMRLGHVIQMIKDPELQKIWSTQGGSYSIILSRHPIDVLRMSDFENIESCHSEGGSYFQCAITEAKGHGPIAYLVNTEDLKKIPDLQNGEIFRDTRRGINGIIPVARLRLRKFVSKDGNIALAIPEDRVYGASGELASSFKNSLLDIVKDAQKDVLGDKRLKMSDFVRHGGSYADTKASTLFNNFFKDDEDSGDTKYSGDDNYDLANQYEQEIDIINQEYRYKFKNPIMGYASVEGPDEHPYVDATGTIKIRLNPDMFIKELAPKDRNSIARNVKELCYSINLYDTISNVEIDGTEIYGTDILIDISPEDNGPDDYRALMENLLEWDRKYDKLQGLIYEEFYKMGYVHPPYHERVHNTSLWQNFVTEETEGGLEVESHPIILANIANRGLPIYRTDDIPGMMEFKQDIQSMLKKELESQQRNYNLQGYLPGVNWGIPKSVNFQIPEVDFYSEDRRNVIMKFKFNFNSNHAHDLSSSLERFITYLDKKFGILVTYFIKLFHQRVVALLGT